MRTPAARDEAGYGGEYDAPDDDGDARDDYAWDDYAWDRDGTTAYWRRRVLILGGGVLALGLCAWLFPGAHRAHPSAAARASMAAAASRPALPPAATGSAWPVPTPTPTDTPTPTPTATATPRASGAASTAPPGRPGAAKHKLSLSYHPRPTGTASAAAARAPACAPADIVLSLFSGQSSYTAGERPVFNVYAVSTSAAACTMRYGAGSVQVLVTRRGRVVWDSAACKPSPAQPARFTPGVPRVLSLIWNRKATKPGGCAGALPAGFAGTVDAVAAQGGQASPVITVKLKR